MANKGKATETVGNMDEQTSQELPNGGKITTAKMTATFSGDIEGSGVSNMVIIYNAEGHSTYRGYELISGSIGGRKGSIVFWLEGAYDGEKIHTDIRFLPETGTDDLAGMTGSGTVKAGHGNKAEYTFEYSFAK